MIMEKVTIPEVIKGNWRIERFKTDRIDFHSMVRGRGVPVGEEFTRLMRGNKLIMSDTPAEMLDHYTAVLKANKSCLINGLGLGMVLKAILENPDVTDVTVIEISQDLIDIVTPHYSDSRVTIICADALTYRPPKDKRYGMVWHDIWDDICVDNLPQMHTLHRKYGGKADWQGSWCRDLCEKHRLNAGRRR